MALQKQTIAFNFASGVDTKSDVKQIPVGKFYDLQNSVFDKLGLLKKRNGYAALTTLTGNASAYITTLNDNLLAITNSFYAYSEANNTWVSMATFPTSEVNASSLIKDTYYKAQCDSAIAANGLMCVVYTDNTLVFGGSTYTCKYSILESDTGNVIVRGTAITPSTGTVMGMPKVFLLGNYFVIVFSVNSGGGAGAYLLQYITIQTASPTTVTSAVTIATDYDADPTYKYRPSYDGVVGGSNLYIVWNTVFGAGPIKVKSLSSSLVLSSSASFAQTGDFLSACFDSSLSQVCIVNGQAANSIWGAISINSSLVQVGSTASGSLTLGGLTTNLACASSSGTMTVFAETSHTSSYDTSIPQRAIGVSSFAVGASGAQTVTIVNRCLGLISRAFIVGGSAYALTTFSSNLDVFGNSVIIQNYSVQPTNFLIDSSGNIIAKFAQANAGGFTINNLSSVDVSSTTAKFTYLVKDSPFYDYGSNYGYIYKFGINFGSITIGVQDLTSIETAATLAISNGYTGLFDGSTAAELGFHIFPDVDGYNQPLTTTKSRAITVTTTTGVLVVQDYQYVVTYEWIDNAGNMHRSAPSVIMYLPAASLTTATCKVSINIPTLRLTSKISNTIRICTYRWSTSDPVYHKLEPILGGEVINDTSVDFITVEDYGNLGIANNEVLYTNGGVVENIGPPPSSAMCIYKSRAVLVDAENRNLLWFSKQIIEATPIEFSDLFTIYVGPSSNDSVSSGPIVAPGVLDDKLIVFKENELFYIVGTGPDNTGSNNDFTDPIYISSIVGCNNKKSIVKTPEGLMFQSSKGIWLLNRNLQVTYIGAPVEQYNSYEVLSAVNIVGTNQVRFAMSDGTTLVYDYFFAQWGTFTGIPMVSSTIYQGKHTFINSSGQVFQEAAGQYYDGTTASPVLMQFTTGPLNVAGVQGFERAYWFTFIGDYLSPHTLTCSVAYDYGSFTQESVVNPDSNDAIEQWQVFFRTQKVQSLQIKVEESYDAGGTPGAGFNMSGLNFQIGIKGGSYQLKQTVSVG